MRTEQRKSSPICLPLASVPAMRKLMRSLPDSGLSIRMRSGVFANFGARSSETPLIVSDSFAHHDASTLSTALWKSRTCCRSRPDWRHWQARRSSQRLPQSTGAARQSSSAAAPRSSGPHRPWRISAPCVLAPPLSGGTGTSSSTPARPPGPEERSVRACAYSRTDYRVGLVRASACPSITT